MESGAPRGSGPGPRRPGFRAAARSDTGLVREHNEDYVYAGHHLIAVADGVGGNVFGEIASELVVGAIAYLDDAAEALDPDHAVREAADTANARLFAAIQENPELLGMATTLTALRLDGASVSVLNIGDSRAYLVRGGECRAITRDDSLVQELARRRRDHRRGGPSSPAALGGSAVAVGRPVQPDDRPSRRDRGGPLPGVQ